jgi:3',5'-cyclic-AMP phosphodiesterase
VSDRIIHDHNHDGLDRRGFLKCVAWAGTGALLAVSGGVLRSQTLSRAGHLKDVTAGDLSFVQISDSHIGFSKEANKDVLSTLKVAIDKINALPTPPAFVLHTGDLSHLSKPEEFDALDQSLKSAKTDRIFYVPGEHDVLGLFT